jgi:hypothetical protein
MELKFKETVSDWLLGGEEGDKKFSMIPPPAKSKDQLLYDLLIAEMKEDMAGVKKAKQAIDRRGYKIQINLVPK